MSAGSGVDHGGDGSIDPVGMGQPGRGAQDCGHMTLTISLVHRFAGFSLDLAFAVPAGALPAGGCINGCGAVFFRLDTILSSLRTAGLPSIITSLEKVMNSAICPMEPEATPAHAPGASPCDILKLDFALQVGLPCTLTDEAPMSVIFDSAILL